jgi:hypothetical protein
MMMASVDDTFGRRRLNCLRQVVIQERDMQEWWRDQEKIIDSMYMAKTYLADGVYSDFLHLARNCFCV